MKRYRILVAAQWQFYVGARGAPQKNLAQPPPPIFFRVI